METECKLAAPRVIKRSCGGWLAVASANSPVRIGVTADSEEQARANLAQALVEWDEIIGGSDED